MGKNIFHAGGPGAGQAAKICNNMMLAINMIGVSEGFLLAQSSAWTGTSCTQITTTSTAQSWALSNYCPAPGPGAGGAVQPRLRARVHGGADAEGREAVAGGGRGDRCRRPRSAPTRVEFYQAAG